MSKSNRDLKMYIDDILESIEAIESYVSDIGSFEDFASDRKTYSATIREYIIIGEAILPIISLLKEVGNGHEVTILSRGTPVAKIVSIKNAALHKNEMKQHLLARIKNQAVTGSRNWTRKELYDDDTCE